MMILRFFMSIQILYEDNHLIAVNKPAGLLTQGDFSQEECVLDVVKLYLKNKYHKPGDVFLGIVHRLDRQVSGVLLLARTSKAASRLFAQFNGRSVIKIYCAIVELHRHDSEVMRAWQYVKTGLRRERDITIICDEKEAESVGELRYRLLHRKGAKALVLVQLITGKKHQIRAQLAAIDLPIAGDLKYGAGSALSDGSICLHSLFFYFSHPTKNEKISIVAPIPSSFENAYPEIHKISNPVEMMTEYAREIISR